VLKWIVSSNQPFLEVESPQLRELFLYANSKAKMPSGTTIQRDIMSAHVKEKLGKISELKTIQGKFRKKIFPGPNSIWNETDRVFCNKLAPQIKSINYFSKTYDKIAGIYAVFTVFTCILAVMEIGRAVLHNSPEVFMEYFYVGSFVIFSPLLAYVGNYMKQKVERSRENLFNIYELSTQEHESACVNPNLETTTKWLLGWKWNFTARNLFDVDYKIFGVVRLNV
ncbi:unnamed protein product, partial [Allacma fusca]